MRRCFSVVKDLWQPATHSYNRHFYGRIRFPLHVCALPLWSFAVKIVWHGKSWRWSWAQRLTPILWDLRSPGSPVLQTCTFLPQSLPFRIKAVWSPFLLLLAQRERCWKRGVGSLSSRYICINGIRREEWADPIRRQKKRKCVGVF